MHASEMFRRYRGPTRFGGVVLAGLLLLACTTAPVPELQKVAFTEAALPLPQELYDECLREALRFPADSPARYNPPETYTFASAMHRGVERVRVLAPRVRAYTPTHAGADVVCYYDGGGANLRYLTYVRSNRDGRAPAHELNRAVLTSYAKMAGKSVTKVLLLGVYVD
jgi:hypothetical protein